MFDAYVESCLGPERELFERISANIADRGGEHLPIEDRMLSSLNRVCHASGKTIDQIDKKRGQWGVNFRERLKVLGKEDLYLSLQRVGSHSVHGTWVDLMLNHLDESASGMYRPKTKKRPGARDLTPTAFLVLDSVSSYVQIYWAGVGEASLLSSTIADLQKRIREFEAIHEAFFQKE